MIKKNNLNYKKIWWEINWTYKNKPMSVSKQRTKHYKNISNNFKMIWNKKETIMSMLSKIPMLLEDKSFNKDRKWKDNYRLSNKSN
jgi:hypothetical protein